MSPLVSERNNSNSSNDQTDIWNLETIVSNNESVDRPDLFDKEVNIVFLNNNDQPNINEIDKLVVIKEPKQGQQQFRFLSQTFTKTLLWERI